MTNHPIAAAKYVSLVSFKRNGDPVSTPVWIVGLPDGRVGFTTDGGSFKVKRIRNNAAVTLQRSDMKGKVVSGPVYPGTAAVVGGAARQEIWKLVRQKYGAMALAISVSDKVKGIFNKKGHEDVAIVIEVA